MTGNLWGADVAQLRTLAQQFGKASESLQQQSTLLTSQINNNTAWKGNDALQFRSDWNGNHHALLQRAADRLKEESKKLLENANQQEKASDAAPGSGGGPMGDGGGGAILGGVLLGGIAGVRAAMTFQKVIKAPFTIAKHTAQYGWVLGQQREAFVKTFAGEARHRIGGPGFAPGKFLTNGPLDDLLKTSSAANRGVAFAEKLSDLASFKNLNQYIGPLSKFEGFFAEKPLVGVGTKLEWLGKSGLGRGLGWAGVGFSTFDSVKSFSEGDVEGGLVNAGKAALGVGCFLPPPAGTVCQIASAGIAIYENWDTICSVGKNVGEGIAAAVNDPGKFVDDTAKSIGDGMKSVGNFFGIGN
ncbi:hypothetical protein ACW0JT_10025 [Arthrobacter sp. SA17]